MTLLKDSRNQKGDRLLAQIGLLAAVPAILLIAPLIGFFAGRWADEKFATEPYLMITGIVLGFAAAAREISNLVKRSQKLEESDKDD